MSGVHLIGSEDVVRAGRNMVGAAETISRAAMGIDHSAGRLADAMDQAAGRIEAAAELFTKPQPTLRDYFAAKAMPTFLDLVPTEVWNQGLGLEGKNDSAFQAAKAAYRMADAMLKARSE